ncbi:hypothetical protein C8R44DRAFT_753409 [Mycena epipterygia]|nr:hypothetical protein C8R44DRAFT_753409 [Mycena epipterygia]
MAARIQRRSWKRSTRSRNRVAPGHECDCMIALIRVSDVQMRRAGWRRGYDALEGGRIRHGDERERWRGHGVWARGMICIVALAVDVDSIGRRAGRRVAGQVNRVAGRVQRVGRQAHFLAVWATVAYIAYLWRGLAVRATDADSRLGGVRGFDVDRQADAGGARRHWASTEAMKPYMRVVSWEVVVERSGAKRSRIRRAKRGFAAAERVRLRHAPAGGREWTQAARRYGIMLLIAFVSCNKVKPSSLERMTGGGEGARTGGARRGVGGTMKALGRTGCEALRGSGRVCESEKDSERGMRSVGLEARKERGRSEKEEGEEYGSILLLRNLSAGFGLTPPGDATGNAGTELLNYYNHFRASRFATEISNIRFGRTDMRSYLM